MSAATRQAGPRMTLQGPSHFEAETEYMLEDIEKLILIAENMYKIVLVLHNRTWLRADQPLKCYVECLEVSNTKKH